MNDDKPKYGIWGGRFQIIHKGHEYVLKYVAENYINVCIGIVNPNPITPPWSVKEHEKFEPERNPFTYFQRMYLWNIILRYHSIDAVIVPHWHPRKSLELEETFLPLPKEDREWVIPNLPGEEYKIKDFKDAKENVHILEIESADLKKIHSSEIKQLYDKGNRDFKADIPEKICSITEKFLRMDRRRCWDEKFIIVPILKESWKGELFCSAIRLSTDCGKQIVFAPVIEVANEERWWKYKSLDINNEFTFYDQYEIINEIMKKLQFYDYLVTPIIVKNNQCEAIDAFLPDAKSRSWLFIDSINDSSIFGKFLRENKGENTNINRNTLPKEVLSEVDSVIKDCFNKLGIRTSNGKKRQYNER